MFRTQTIAILLTVLSLVSACGFQLQGAFTTPADMQNTHIATDDKLSPFYRELRRQLQASGVNLVDFPGDASAVFSISFEETGQRVLSVSARNVPTEYEVFYSVEYDLAAATKSLMATQTLTLTRDYTYDAEQVLGKAREEALLREAIVDDLVRIVLKQISTL